MPTHPPDAHVDTTVQGAGAESGFSLLVSCAAGVFVMSLGEKTEVVLGRGSDCDVVIADASVSRRHAKLRLGASMTLEDLESRNGTTIMQRALAPGEHARVHVGFVFELGNATLVLQRARDLPAAAPRAARPSTIPPPSTGADVASLVKADPTVARLYAMLDVVAPSALSVLILGETGVGKEVFAEELHRRSTRADRPFLRLNCAALPESILEGELFGYERGAFTGAVQAKPGLFESADGGTVFLDEVGDLPMPIQAKLLRVLETGEVLRLGSVKPKQVDVRFLSATNRDLRKLIAAGGFRADLFFRVNGISITLPPLRNRKADIAPLARLFVQRIATRHGRPAPALTPRAIVALEEHDWPGNVRELRNVVERAALLSGGRELGPEHLMLHDLEEPLEESPTTPSSAPPAAVDREPASATRLHDEVESLYRLRVIDALQRTGGNQSQAAKLLGIGRRTLIKRIEAYGLERPRKGKP